MWGEALSLPRILMGRGILAKDRGGRSRGADLGAGFEPQLCHSLLPGLDISVMHGRVSFSSGWEWHLQGCAHEQSWAPELSPEPGSGETQVPPQLSSFIVGDKQTLLLVASWMGGGSGGERPGLSFQWSTGALRLGPAHLAPWQIGFPGAVFPKASKDSSWDLILPVQLCSGKAGPGPYTRKGEDEKFSSW